jgi:hypothetical protein
MTGREKISDVIDQGLTMETSSLFMTAGGRHVSKGHARAGPIASMSALCQKQT